MFTDNDDDNKDDKSDEILLYGRKLMQSYKNHPPLLFNNVMLDTVFLDYSFKKAFN